MRTPASDSPYWEAIERLRALLDEAHRRELAAPYAASLATADASARPSVRVVSIVEVGDAGPAFFVDAGTGKGRQLAANPHAALCFFWAELHHQVVVEGRAAFATDPVADRLWSGRPRDSQLATWASLMDPGDHEGPDAGVAAARERFAWDPVPRPPGWQAVRLHPELFQFWKTRWRSPQPRELYVHGNDDTWTKARADPLRPPRRDSGGTQPP